MKELRIAQAVRPGAGAVARQGKVLRILPVRRLVVVTQQGQTPPLCGERVNPSCLADDQVELLARRIREVIG